MFIFELLFLAAVGYQFVMLTLSVLTLSDTKQSNKLSRRAFNILTVLYICLFIIITKAFDLDVSFAS